MIFYQRLVSKKGRRFVCAVPSFGLKANDLTAEHAIEKARELMSAEIFSRIKERRALPAPDTEFGQGLMPSVLAQIAANIDFEMRATGMTTTELVRVAKTSWLPIAGLLDGTLNPTVGRLENVALALGCDLIITFKRQGNTDE